MTQSGSIVNRLVRCSSCGGTSQPMRKDSRNAVACNDCFRRWRFLGPDAAKNRAEWKVIEAPNNLPDRKDPSSVRKAASDGNA